MQLSSLKSPLSLLGTGADASSKHGSYKQVRFAFKTHTTEDKTAAMGV